MTPRLKDLSIDEQQRRIAESFYRKGMYSLALEEFEALLRSPVHTPDAEARIRWHLAVCYVATGATDKADKTVDVALTIERIPENLAERLKSVQGYAAFSRGDYERAREICLGTVAALRKLGDPRGLTTAFRYLAMTYFRIGDLEAAFENAYCALAEARVADDEGEVGHAHGVLTMGFIQSGQYEAALKHGTSALEIATRLGHHTGVARHNINLSIAARLSGELDLATTYAQRALVSAEEANLSTLALSARLAAARALRESGRLESARNLVEGALLLAAKSQRERDRVLALEDFGDLDMLAGDVRHALEKYVQAWRVAEKIAEKGDLVAELGWRIGIAHLELGELERALPWVEKSLVVCKEAGERKEYALALRARGLCFAYTDQEADARRDLEAALLILESLRVPYEQAQTHLAFDRALRECAEDTSAVKSERSRHLAAARRLLDRLGCIGAKAPDAIETPGPSLKTIEIPDERVAPPTTVPRRRASSILAKDWPSPAFGDTLHDCRKLGPTNLPLLLVGPTGSGKTILADALHKLGRRAEGDIFSVNCATLPDHLQESELFGHRKGAFTGAERDHPGIFREAGSGTVFLDEIDKTSLEFQAKLLQVLDSREVRPVGSTRLVTIDARIVCATNRDLFALVADGEFLEDLHHRLTCGIIQVPSLKDRIEDLRLLSRILLEEIASLERTIVPEIDEEAWEVLRAHDWPGNVRELKSLLHRAVALNPGEEILDAETILASAPLGSTLKGSRSRVANGSSLAERMASAEREEILRALEKAGGVRRKAAELLNISYRGLNKKMARLKIGNVTGIEPEDETNGTA